MPDDRTPENDPGIEGMLPNSKKHSSTRNHANIGMGAILDVVYNHTAKVDIFEC